MTRVPVQGGKIGTGKDAVKVEADTVPEWLAQEAYAEYVRHFGSEQTFERLHERGGFGPSELMDLLAGGFGDGTVLNRLRATRSRRPIDARREILTGMMEFALQATENPVKQEALALLILRAVRWLLQRGYRPGEIERATLALTEKL